MIRLRPIPKKIKKIFGFTPLCLTLYLAVFLTLVICIAGSAAAYTNSLQNKYNLSFMSYHSIGKSVLKDQGYGSKFWTLNVFYGDSTQIDYSKDFWMPIEQWEYTVCSRGLSTQLAETGVVSGGVGSSSPSGIYADALSVAAYKRYSANSSDTELLYEISWYFQPAIIRDNGYYYYVNVTGPDESREILVRGEASRKTGSSGYDAFYSAATYTTVVVSYDGNRYEFPIVSVIDTNR